MSLNKFKVEMLQMLIKHETSAFVRDMYQLQIRDELRNNGISVENDFAEPASQLKEVQASEPAQIKAPEPKTEPQAPAALMATPEPSKSEEKSGPATDLAPIEALPIGEASESIEPKAA